MKKKWIQSSKRGKTIPNLTAGIETGLPLTQRGMKKNEMSKAARRKDPKNQRKMTFSLVSLSNLPLYSPGSLLVSQVHPSLVFHSLVISILNDYNSTISGYLPSSGSSRASFLNSLYTSYPSSSFTQASVFHPSHHIGSSQPTLMRPFGEQSNSMGSSTAFNHHV